MKIHPHSTSRLLTCVFALLLTTPAGAGDEEIFSSQVPPNVLLFIDNSGSMNAIMEHSSFDAATAVNTCDIIPETGSGSSTKTDDNGVVTNQRCDVSGCKLVLDSSAVGFTRTPSTSDHPDNGYITRTFCKRTRRLYHDGTSEAAGHLTWHYSEYLEWLYSIGPEDGSPDPGTLYGPAGEQKTATQILAEIYDGANGQDFITGTRFGKFQRSKINGARSIATDVIYQTNSDCPAYLGDCGKYEDRVRFGLAKFQPSSHGGYVQAPIEPYSTNKSALETAIDSLEAETATPLAESLFKMYTYFMSRDSSKLPKGKDGSTSFPKYSYKTSDGSYSGGDYPPDPMSQSCQKNFVILVTDGEPTYDDFSTSGSETQGFDDFESKLIGDYAPDAAGDPDIGTDSTPEVGDPPWGSSRSTGYLDDVALFMQQNDCRPDYPATKNVVDVYTVGFGTQGPVNSLLQKTAKNGNGIAFLGTQAEEITEALVRSIQDIFSKSQGFAAATVPAARTSDGGNIYTSLFQPTSSRPFWPGILKSYEITKQGDVLDKNGGCALVGSSDPANCKSGAFKDEGVAPPFWNAGYAMPAPNDRKLYVSINTGSAQVKKTFDHVNLGTTELDLTSVVVADFPTAGAVSGVSLLDEAVVAYVAGCEWGTGMATGTTDAFDGCVSRTRSVDGQTRADRLGDIFHSDPVVVGPPNDFVDDASYFQFANDASHVQRQRVIYAGANDGFLHGFNAGTYNSISKQYGQGDGSEVFGFMPWGARVNAEEIARENGLHPILADGSPSVADVWIDRDSDPDNAKISSEWKTVLVSGLREGGEHYFALDITDPASSSYPGYMWEYPIEADASARAQIGQTWSKPVITRVRLARSDGKIVEQWVAIFGFGYDPTSDPNEASYDATSLKGRGIGMLDIETGALIAARKFGSGTNDIAEMLYAIPSAPSVLDLDQDGFADVIYVGDIGGNIWKWVIRAAGTHDPSSSEIHQANWSFRKFFSEDPSRTSGHRRSFFYSPAVTSVSGVLYLAAGTGERTKLNCSSILDGCTLKNRYYVLKDHDRYDGGSPSTIDGRENAPGDLTDITAFADRCPTTEPAGYFYEVSDGEKFVTNNTVFDAFFFASTYKPSMANVCEPNGTSKLYGALAKCGQGFFGPPSSYNPEAGVNRNHDLGKGFSSDARLSLAPGEGGNRIIISKQDGEFTNMSVGTSASEHGTLYWRELD